ncbi:MAG: RadC family protein [Planctomycetota bacterium]
MTDEAPDPGGALADKPYGAIFQQLRGNWRASDAGARTEAPDYARPRLVRFCRRLGAIPKSWSGDRAAGGVRKVCRRMAADAAESPAEVSAALLRFCNDDDPKAVCVEHPFCAECDIEHDCEYPDRRPTIKDMPKTERPRERLLRAGEEHLSDVELLALIIGGGSSKETALDLARRLLSRFESFRRLSAAPIGRLTRIHGIGPAKAARIKAALGIARRYAAEKLPTRTRVSGSRQLFRYMREKLAGRDREHFCTLLLDTKHQILREKTVAVGSLNESVVHPREVFKEAIAESAAAVIFVHNHPSGNPEPSPQDKRLTSRLCRAGELVGIEVLDHVIVGGEEYFSFAEMGLLDGGGAAE